MKDKISLLLAYMVAGAEIGGGLYLLGGEVSCLNGFPHEILDRPFLWNEYLQVIMGAAAILSGWEFAFMFGKILSDNGRLRGYEVNKLVIRETAPLWRQLARGGRGR